MTTTGNMMMYEVINSAELAERLKLPESWIRNHTQSTAADRIPHVKAGRYVRYEWGSPELTQWWHRQRQK